VSHVHIKDVSEISGRGGARRTDRIAVSQCAIGEGVNASNIRTCIAMLQRPGSMASSVSNAKTGGPMIERSLAWVRDAVRREAGCAVKRIEMNSKLSRRIGLPEGIGGVPWNAAAMESSAAAADQSRRRPASGC